LYDKGYLLKDGKKDIVILVFVKSEGYGTGIFDKIFNFMDFFPEMSDELREIGIELDETMYNLIRKRQSILSSFVIKCRRTCSYFPHITPPTNYKNNNLLNQIFVIFSIPLCPSCEIVGAISNRQNCRGVWSERPAPLFS